MRPIHQLAPAHARFIHDFIIIKTRINVKRSFAGRPKFPSPAGSRQSGPPAFAAGQAKCRGELFEFAMSVLFFKRFLKRPLQIASIMPSSQALVERVASKIDFEQARVIAEYGPGEGVHSRALAQRMRPDAQLLLFELDPHFSRDLARQFADDPRVRVINANATTIRATDFASAESEYFLQNIPPMFITVFRKATIANGNGAVDPAAHLSSKYAR